MSPKKTKTSIIIPAHNERDNLPKLLESYRPLRRGSLRDSEVIIVDDASTDDTGVIADRLGRKHSWIKAIHRPRGRNGMGAALKEGTRKAEGTYIVWVMGDNSDDLSTIPKMIRSLEKGEDMVFGSRYMKGGSSGNLSPLKAFLSSGYTLMTRLVFGIRQHDITNAFRAFKKNLFMRMILEADNFAIAPEFAIKARRAGFRLAEVPTTYRDREAGEAKFKLLRMGLSYCALLRFRIVSPRLFMRKS